MGVAYDVFGNGKTAVKFNLGRYMEAITASNNDLDMNPLIRTATTTTRGFNDLCYPDGDPRRGTSCRTAISTTRQRTANARRWTTRTWGKPVFTRTLRPQLRRRLGHPAVQLGARPVGAAGSGAARLGERRLQPQLVGQLVCRGQPGDHVRGLHAVQHRGAARSAAARTAAAIRSAACTTSCRPRSGRWTSSRNPRATSASRSRTGRAWMSPSTRGCGTGSRCRRARAPGAGSRTAAPCAPVLPELGAGPTGVTNSSVTANVNALGGGAFALGVNNPYCRIAEPYRTDFRGLASYVIPKVDVRVAATWASIPGDSLRGGLHRDQRVDRRRTAAARPGADRGRHRLR